MIVALKNCLEMHDLSVAKAAKKVGISRSYMDRIIKGQRRPSLPVAKRISRTFGLDIHIFFD